MIFTELENCCSGERNSRNGIGWALCGGSAAGRFIYELEMYYGDETLKNLIRHSRDLRNYMTKYKEVMELLEDQEQIIEEDIDDEDEITETAENNEEKEKFASKSGKTLFYSGT